MAKKINRRDFIRGMVGIGLSLTALNGLSFLSSCADTPHNPYNAQGLPVSYLGNTGVLIPRIVLGLGSRFCHIESEDESEEMLNYALDNGFYYWDTAHIYDNSIAAPPGKSKSSKHIISEERVGKVIRYRRKEVFLSTKVTAREPSEAMKQIELSLKRLHTDKLDMLKIHDVSSLEDVDQMSRPGHLIDIVHRLKEEGVTRFIGYSGHSNAEAMKEMTKRGNFDSMLIAMNHWNRGNDPQPREEVAIPAALAKDMGVLLMKAIRPKETIPDINIEDLVRYALCLKGPHAVVIGMDSMDVVKSNLNILRNFTELSPEEMRELANVLKPFYRSENLPWMQKNYTDGNWEL